MTAPEKRARNLIGSLTTAHLLDQWEMTTTMTDPNTSTLRGWLMENARPEEKPAAIPEKPGLYCYTPEMGEQKPKCQIEAERSYYGRHYHINTPLELKGRGIKKDGVKEAKNLRPNYQYMDGWFEYTVTERAFEKLQEQYTISQELLLD